VLNSELKISFPKDMNVKYIIRGNGKEKVIFKEETKRGERIYTFTATDLPDERRYADAPAHAWFALHVIFFIENYKNEKGETVRYLGGLDDLYRLNYGFIKELNKETKPVLKQLVDSLTKNAPTQEQKARNIYRWVQENVKYVAFEEGMEGFIPRDANLVCTRRFGDCKDMASILTLMLNTAGVPAYYTWIGTRHLPYRYEEVPTPIVDNHMICTILLDGKYIFLDGTDATCVFGTPSQGIQGKEALLSIDEKNYKVLTVPVPEKSVNTFTDSTFLEIGADGLIGRISQDYRGYYAMGLNASLTYTLETNRERMMRTMFGRGSNKFNLVKFDEPRKHDFSRISLSGEFMLPDYARKAGNDIFINLNLFKHYLGEEIDFPKRKMPIELDFHFVRNYVTVLKIPAGYKVAYLPESKSFYNKIWGFDIKYEQKGDAIILTQSFTNEHLLLTPDQFQEWNKVLESLFPLYKESVNLTKI
ncbi:MAG: transglutaminase domain-containing protein, partial [Chitinophagaceae bacterium]